MSAPRFNNSKPPPNYVAGLGRGATGFTTRSDIGPARMLPGSEPAAVGAGAGGPGPSAAGMGADKPQDLSETKFDKFSGYDEQLFRDTPYEEDDKLADEVWNMVDQQMDKRRRKKREERERAELEEFRRVRPKLQHQFADLKRDLEQVSQEDWESLPEPGAHIKGAQAAKRNERFTKAPDSLLARARGQAESAGAVDSRVPEPPGVPGQSGQADGSATDLADLKSLGAARNSVLSVKLDLMADSVEGQTVVDPKGYLTSLSGIKVSSDAEIGDIKKARLLLDSVRQTNPKHGPAWIASARLEEVAGRHTRAREIMKEACNVCSDSEDVWLEAARLHPDAEAKAVLAQAVRKVPSSVKVWLTAASLESEERLKRLVLRKALEIVPNSVKLWQAAIDLEEPKDARLMLERATECVPHSVDMWLALARLQGYTEAKVTLNKALKAVPTEPVIWVAAAKLEEANGNWERCDKLVDRALRYLSESEVVLERDVWLAEAEAAELAGMPHTCRALIKQTLAIGIDELDRLRIWLDDAAAFADRGAHQCASAVYHVCIEAFKEKPSVWKRAAEHEKVHGTREALHALLSLAVRHCPQAEGLWLMRASELRAAGEVEGARRVLEAAFEANRGSENVWLAAVDLEFEEGEVERARGVLTKARENAGTEQIWRKSVWVERCLGNAAQAHALADGGLRAHPQSADLFAAKARVETAGGRVDAARATYQRGLTFCPSSAQLWNDAARMEEASGSVGKARSLLDRARLKSPAMAELWLEGVRLELRAGETRAAMAMMAKALQQCPKSGPLWAEAIAMEPRPTQKSKAQDAMKRVGDQDAFVVLAVSRLFWRDRKLDKARTWCNRAAALDPLLGDAWANYLAFETEHGTPEQQAKVVEGAVAAKPERGDHWSHVVEDPANHNLNTEEVLRAVARAMQLS